MSRAKFAVLVLGGLGFLGAWAEGAHAQECSDTSPCPRGFKCEVTGMSACSTPTPGILPVACADAGPCPAPNPAPRPEPDCRPQEYRSCVPGPCMADGDCASGMVCHEEKIQACSSPGSAPCAPGVPCMQQMLPPTCTETVERQCVPRHLLPCSQASDCGAGFTCEPQQQCGCSGSAGRGAPVPTMPVPTDGGAAPEPAPGPMMPAADAGAPSDAPALPAPPECSCTPTSVNYCKPLELDCTSDAQCPPMWGCRVVATSASDPACLPGRGDAGTCGADRPAPAEIRRCVPPYDGINVGVGRGGDGVATPTTGTPGSVPQPSPNAPVPPSAQVDGGLSAGEGTSTPDVPVHTKACSVTRAGAGSNEGFPLWAGVLSLAATWVVTRRRR